MQKVKTQTITISIKKPKSEAVKPNIRQIFSIQPGDLNKLYAAIEKDLNDSDDQESKHLKIRFGNMLRTYRQERNLLVQEFCDKTGIEGTTLILAERGLLCDEELTDALSAIDYELETSFEAVYQALKAIEMDL